MRKLLITGGMLLAAAAAWAEEPDTIKVMEQPRQVTVTTHAGVTTVQILGSGAESFSYVTESKTDSEESGQRTAENAEGTTETEEPEDDWSPTLPFLNQRGWKRVNAVALSGAYCGWLHPFDADAWVKGGWEVGFTRVLGIDYKPWRHGPTLGTGVGLGFRTYLAQKWARYERLGDVLAGVPYAEGERRDYSRLLMFDFQVPLLVSQRIARDFGITLGGIMNFNTYAWATTQYYSGDARYKTEYTGLRQRFVTFDLVAMLGWADDLNVYFRYSPMQPFQDGMGPRMKSLSVGASIGF